MSKIEARIVADSITEREERLTTMIVTFPRYILAELNTHRMFSKNSASSRAIPFKKMVESVKSNPFIPIAWQKDHSGMQGTEYLKDDGPISESMMAKSVWLTGRDWAVKTAESLHNEDNGFPSVTKQLVNRLLEPFMWHTVLITATEWDNFFNLRCPQYEIEGYRSGTFYSKKSALKAWAGKGDCPKENDLQGWLNINKGQADIHMMALAEAMYDAYNEGTPKLLQPGEWHIPFGDNIDRTLLIDSFPNQPLQELAIKIAVARCARVSYTVVGEEGKPINYENDLKLYDRLASSEHWSPFEHVGRAMTKDEYNSRLHIANYGQHGWSGNFKGFIQYRKLL